MNDSSAVPGSTSPGFQGNVSAVDVCLINLIALASESCTTVLAL